MKAGSSAGQMMHGADDHQQSSRGRGKLASILKEAAPGEENTRENEKLSNPASNVLHARGHWDWRVPSVRLPRPCMLSWCTPCTPILGADDLYLSTSRIHYSCDGFVPVLALLHRSSVHGWAPTYIPARLELLEACSL
jgi:hypothetical protein